MRGNVIRFDTSDFATTPTTLAEADDVAQCERLADYLYGKTSGKLYVTIQDSVITIVTPTALEGVIAIEATMSRPTWVTDIRMISECAIHSLPLPTDTGLDTNAMVEIKEEHGCVELTKQSRVWKALKQRKPVDWIFDAEQTLSQRNIQLAAPFTREAWCRFKERACTNFNGALVLKCERLAYQLDINTDRTLDVLCCILFGIDASMPWSATNACGYTAPFMYDVVDVMFGKKKYFAGDAFGQVFFKCKCKQRRIGLSLRSTLWSDQASAMRQIAMALGRAEMFPVAPSVSELKDAMSFVFATVTVPHVIGGTHNVINLNVAVRIIEAVLLLPMFKWMIPFIAVMLRICESILVANGDYSDPTMSDAIIGVWTAIQLVTPSAIIEMLDALRGIEVEVEEDGETVVMVSESEKLSIDAKQLSCAKVSIDSHHSCSPELIIRKLTCRMIATKRIKTWGSDRVEEQLLTWHRQSKELKSITGRERAIGFRLHTSQLLANIDRGTPKKLIYDVFTPRWLLERDGYLLLCMSAIREACTTFPRCNVQLPLRSNQHNGCVVLTVGENQIF